jgi:hypothetical protein
MDEVIGVFARPAKFEPEPRQPYTLSLEQLTASDKPPADLDRTLECLLTNPPNCIGVLGKFRKCWNDNVRLAAFTAL